MAAISPWLFIFILLWSMPSIAAGSFFASCPASANATDGKTISGHSNIAWRKTLAFTRIITLLLEMKKIVIRHTSKPETQPRDDSCFPGVMTGSAHKIRGFSEFARTLDANVGCKFSPDFVAQSHARRQAG